MIELVGQCFKSKLSKRLSTVCGRWNKRSMIFLPILFFRSLNVFGPIPGINVISENNGYKKLGL